MAFDWVKNKGKTIGSVLGGSVGLGIGGPLGGLLGASIGGGIGSFFDNDGSPRGEDAYQYQRMLVDAQNNMNSLLASQMEEEKRVRQEQERANEYSLRQASTFQSMRQRRQLQREKQAAAQVSGRVVAPQEAKPEANSPSILGSGAATPQNVLDPTATQMRRKRGAYGV
jgi:hypothetical protein